MVSVYLLFELGLLISRPRLMLDSIATVSLDNMAVNVVKVGVNPLKVCSLTQRIL